MWSGVDSSSYLLESSASQGQGRQNLIQVCKVDLGSFGESSNNILWWSFLFFINCLAPPPFLLMLQGISSQFCIFVQVHFTGYPGNILIPCDGEDSVKWSFINSLKEVRDCFVRFILSIYTTVYFLPYIVFDSVWFYCLVWNLVRSYNFSLESLVWQCRCP